MFKESPPPLCPVCQSPPDLGKKPSVICAFVGKPDSVVAQNLSGKNCVQQVGVKVSLNPPKLAFERYSSLLDPCKHHKSGADHTRTRVCTAAQARARAGVYYTHTHTHTHTHTLVGIDKVDLIE